MSAWIGFVIVVSLIVLIGLTLRIHAEAEQRSRRRQKPSPDGGTPENIHYFPSGNDLWGRLLSGDHSAHHHSGHLDGSHGLGGGDGEAGEMAVVAASAIEGAPELKDQRFDLAQLPLFGFTPV